jgi:hypothetical protein
MRQSCVRVRAGGSVGSGFFVTPQLVLTCFHVVRYASLGELVQIEYHGVTYDAEVVLKEPASWDGDPAYPYPDVALLKIDREIGEAVTFDGSVPLEGARLRLFGFSDPGDAGGEYATATYEDRSYYREAHDEFRLIVKNAQISTGMSGAPLYIDESSAARVVGMITISNDRYRQQGGMATPSQNIIALIQRFGDLLLYEEATTAPEVFVDTTTLPEVDQAALDASSAHALRMIDEIGATRRTGRPRRALELARQMIAELPEGVSPSIRARCLRTLSASLIENGDESSEAQRFASEAATLDRDPVADARLDAIIARIERGTAAGIAAIPVGLSPELESLRALYLLEENNEPAARAILETLPTSEADKARVRCTRLIAAIIGKRREEALRLADGLVTAASEDLMLATTVCQAYVYGSIPTHFWPASLAIWPQPVPQRELIADPEQPARLRTASNIADQILANDELDGVSRNIVEIIKLASLLLDPTKRSVGAAYAAEILQP